MVNICKNDSIELLKKVLSIPSVNGIDNETNIARYIKEIFEQYNIQSEIQYIDNNHANVIAVLAGHNNSKIVWNGHIDTVPYGNIDEWNTNPCVPVIKDNNIIARGASDMKSGLAAMIYALCVMKKYDIKPDKTICFIATCDEEKGGLGASHILKKGIMESAEVLVIGEPTGCQLGIAQKGCIWLELEVFGKTSHGAYPKEGVNAVYYSFLIFNQLKEYINSYTHPLLGNPTAQITLIQGGVAPNMTPDICKITIDVRVIPGLTELMIAVKLDEIINIYRAQTNNQLFVKKKLLNDRMPIETSELDKWFIRFKDILLELDLFKEKVGIHYFTDASILTKNNKEIPVILFGPGEPNMAHQPNEYVSIDKYLRTIEILIKVFADKAVYLLDDIV